MRLVVDTNQASLLPSGGEQSRVVSLSPYVLSEILLRADPNPTLQLLRTFDIRLGLETSDVIRQLAQLSPQEIRAFKPFPVPGQTYRQNYEAMQRALYDPWPQHVSWARYIKDSHRRFCESLVERAKRVRKHLRERRMEDHKISTFQEALSEFSSTPGSFLGSVIVSLITNDGARSTQAQPAELLDAVMSNQYVGRLFRVQLAYHISISRLWEDQNLNFDPSPGRDDMTDISLPLYAADGDVIVTADTKLALLVSLTEPEGKVKACKAGEIA